MKHPHNFSETELRKVGVEIRDYSCGILGCLECGRGWAVNALGRGKRLPRGYWHCPNGCNVDE